MFRHSIVTASFFCVLMAALLFSLSLPGVAGAQSNTTPGTRALQSNTMGTFGRDGVGRIGSETTINSGDLAGILMIAVQGLETRTAELKQKEAQIAVLALKVEELRAKQAYFETVAARLEALEFRQNQSIQVTAEKSFGGKMVDVMP